MDNNYLPDTEMIIDDDFTLIPVDPVTQVSLASTMDLSPVDENIYNHSKAYLASIVEKEVIKSIQRQGRQKCQKCIEIFVENELVSDQLIHRKNQSKDIILPCESTVNILKTVDRVLKSLRRETMGFSRTLQTILTAIDFDSLYQSSIFEEEHHSVIHKHDIVKEIVSTYLKNKSVEESMRITAKIDHYVVRNH